MTENEYLCMVYDNKYKQTSLPDEVASIAHYVLMQD